MELTNMKDSLFKTHFAGRITTATVGRRGTIRSDIKNFALSHLDNESPKKQKDLLYFTDIFVSQGWNLNDDIFLKEELIGAADTIPLKPVDWEHEKGNIIGVNYDSCIASKDGKILTEEDAVKHDGEIDIISSSVIYKWLFPEEAHRVQASADIESESFNKYQVSMECYFKSYDYGIADGDSTIIINRNNETSHLDSKLRACGGRGLYDGKKIGRVLRGIIFGGKGIVENPANIESVIMSAAKIMPEEETEESKKLVLGNVAAANVEKEEVMAEETRTDGITDTDNKEEVKVVAEEKKEEDQNKVTAQSLEVELASTMIKIRECNDAINAMYNMMNTYSENIKNILDKLVADKEKFANDYAMKLELTCPKCGTVSPLSEKVDEAEASNTAKASENKEEEKKEEGKVEEKKEEVKVEEKKEEEKKEEVKAEEKKEEEKAEEKKEEKVEEKKEEKKEEEKIETEKKDEIKDIKDSVEALKRIVEKSREEKKVIEIQEEKKDGAQNEYISNFPVDMW